MRIRKPLCCLGLGALALAATALVVTTLLCQDLARPAQAQAEASVRLDMNPNNGSGPCNPIDDSVDVSQGSEYTVAICLTGSDTPPNSFEAHINHDDSIGQCVPVDCPDNQCLDGNPDANAGNTTFSTPSLGNGWDCFVADISPPSCKDVAGQISIACINPNEPGTLPVGQGVSSPVAVIHFKAASQGTDSLSIFSATAAAHDLSTIFVCDEEGGSCRGGTVVVGPPAPESPTPVETAVETPAPGITPPTVGPVDSTATAAAAAPAATAAAAAAATAVAQGTPMAAINQAATATSAAAATKAAIATKATVVATSTPKQSAGQQKSGGSSGPNGGLIAGIVVAVLVVGGGAGWFTFRKLRSRGR